MQLVYCRESEQCAQGHDFGARPSSPVSSRTLEAFLAPFPSHLVVGLALAQGGLQQVALPGPERRRLAGTDASRPPEAEGTRDGCGWLAGALARAWFQQRWAGGGQTQ